MAWSLQYKSKMSSFENFKKSQNLSRSHRSSRVSFKSFEADGPNMANVSFNTNQIVFRWNEGQDTITNQQLRVANRTGTRLYYQVIASHPEYYDIRPNQDILEINGIATIGFRINKKKIIEYADRNIYSQDKIKTFFKNNTVQFCWGQITEENINYNQIPRTQNRQMLKVRVEGVQNIDFSHNKSPKNASYTKPYNQQLNIKENRMMAEPQGFDESNKAIMQYEQPGEYSSLLTIPIIAAVAFFSFIIGYISA